MLKILISNDDGIYADGIQQLAKTLSDIADLRVIAPDRNRSGASNSLSLDRPLKVQKLPNLGENMYSVNGTPTDCVHLAVTGLFDELPDMVISGINEGANLGDDVLYSGTVAAAMEGRFLGYPAMAVSLANTSNSADTIVKKEYYLTAAKVVKDLVELILEHGLPKNTILNVNVPTVAYEDLKGFKVTRCGFRHPSEPTIFAKDPRGKDIFWIGPAGQESESGPETDFYAIKQNMVSITPLNVDMTAHSQLEELSSWVRTHINCE